MRAVLFFCLALLFPLYCCAQRPARQFTSTHYQNLIDRSKWAQTPGPEKKSIESWYGARLDIMKLLLEAAKDGKTTEQVRPDSWSVTAGRKPKLSATFRDAVRRAEVVAELEALIKRLETDKADLIAGKALNLRPVDLQADYGYIHIAKYVMQIEQRLHVWEVNGAPVVIDDFEPLKEGKRTLHPEGKRTLHPEGKAGDWFLFAQYDWPPVAFVRQGLREVELDGKKRSVPVFRRLAPEKFAEEEKRAGIRLLIVDDHLYGLQARPE